MYSAPGSRKAHRLRLRPSYHTTSQTGDGIPHLGGHRWPWMGVEVAVHRGFTGLAVEIAPFPGAVAGEAVAGKIRGGLEGLLVCRSRVQAQRLIGSLTVSCVQDLPHILRRWCLGPHEQGITYLLGIPASQDRHMRALARGV